MATLTQDNESYVAGAFSSTNGIWNKGSLVNGVGYTQTIQINEATFPDGVSMTWSWPESGNGSVYAYPEISWGGNGHVVQLADLVSLDATYDFRPSGDLSGFNVAFEAWLYPDARGVWETTTSEVMLWVHSNGWKPQFEGTFTDPYITADLEIDPNWGDLSGGSDHTWQYVAAISRSDKFSGVVSYSNLLKDLIWKGVLTGYEFMRTLEVGAETMHGKGGLTVANLDIAEAVKTRAVGGAGDDSFTAKPVGQNHVVGGGGTDTVAYSGAFAAYEVQARAADVLVRAKGDLSTLDMLQSVEEVRFADGVYDWATRTFTPTGAAPTVVAIATASASAAPVTGLTLEGTAGPDLLFGTSSGDYVRGLDGNDQIDAAGGADDANGNVGTDTVRGGEGADWVRGGRDNDFVYGDGGDDPHVNGNLGDDNAYGGAGNDTAYGGQGADKLYGEAGDDRLSGDIGDDTLSGGAGADRFVFGKGGGVDWVSDFNSAQGDRIQLATGTAYTLTSVDGQTVVDRGGGDRIGLAGVSAAQMGDWLVYA